jgi:hypothetical protein
MTASIVGLLGTSRREAVVRQGLGRSRADEALGDRASRIRHALVGGRRSSRVQPRDPQSIRAIHEREITHIARHGGCRERAHWARRDIDTETSKVIGDHNHYDRRRPSEEENPVPEGLSPSEISKDIGSTGSTRQTIVMDKTRATQHMS